MTLAMQRKIKAYSLDDFLDFIINNIDEKKLSKEETEFLIRTFYDKYCKEDKTAKHHKCKLFFEKVGGDIYASHCLSGENQSFIILSNDIPLFFGIILITHEDRHEVQRLKSYLLEKNKDKIEYVNFSTDIKDNCDNLYYVLEDCYKILEKIDCPEFKKTFKNIENLFLDMTADYCNYYGSYPFEIDAREVSIKFFKKLTNKYPDNNMLQFYMEYLYEHNNSKLDKGAKYYKRYSIVKQIKKAKLIYFEMLNESAKKELEYFSKFRELNLGKKGIEKCVIELQKATERLKEILKNATIFCEKHKFNESVVNEMLFLNEVFEIVNKEEDKQVVKKSKKMARQQKLEDFLYNKKINDKLKMELSEQKKKIREMEQEKQEFLNNYSKF